MQEVIKNFSCVMGNIWLARKKHTAAYISSEAYGCLGGAFYCSMMKPNLKFMEYYVSTGIPGTLLKGERYLPSAEAMRKYLAKVNPRNLDNSYTQIIKFKSNINEPFVWLCPNGHRCSCVYYSVLTAGPGPYFTFCRGLFFQFARRGKEISEAGQPI